MLYDKKMEGKRLILIKQRNGISYNIFAGTIGDYDACILSRDDQAQALLDKRCVFSSNTPIEISICESIIIGNNSVYISALNFLEHVKQKKRRSIEDRSIGSYYIDFDEIDTKKNYIAGGVIIEDVESITADPEYFIGLLNAGMISIDNEAMRQYGLTPKWVLYRNNPENPKKYIK